MQYGEYFVSACPDNGIERTNPATGETEICSGYYCQVYTDSDYENQVENFCLAIGYEIPDDSEDSLDKGIRWYLNITKEEYNDGYLSHNGAILLDCYNTPEKVDELLKLGDLSYLSKSLYPNPSYPHSFDYSKRQKDVTVAYGRDRGDKDVAAREKTIAQLDAPDNWTEYVYIFAKENEWKYFTAGHSKDGLRDVKKDLEVEYAEYGIKRSKSYDGIITDSLVEQDEMALLETDAEPSLYM